MNVSKKKSHHGGKNSLDKCPIGFPLLSLLFILSISSLQENQEESDRCSKSA
jgi:hypothetical protein